MERWLTKLLVVAVVVLFSSQASAQTYGIFAEKDIYNLDGNLFECDSCEAVIQIDNGLEEWWIVASDSSFFGEEAIRIRFDGFTSDDRVMFSVDAEETGRTLNFSEWNDGELAFYIKLIEPEDVHIAVRSLRNRQSVSESDEPLSWWGLDPSNTTDWQKIYVDPTNLEERLHEFDQFTYFAFRSRNFASNFILDEVYVVYGLKKYGVFADDAAFTGEGSMGLSIETENDATIETVPGLEGDGLHVTFGGGGADRVIFLATDTTEAGTAAFPRWNDPLANLVFYIKLNEPVDVSVEISALRNGQSVNASDEPLSQHGLDVNNTTNWQRIVLDLADGLEGDEFDYEQFESFIFRSRGNASDFIVDEIHVRYPESPTVSVQDGEKTIPTSLKLEQNYPNPFNPATTIEFSLPQRQEVTLKVYDLLGREVATLVNANIEAGVHSVTFDASNLPSGVYIYRLQAGEFTETKKMVFLK